MELIDLPSAGRATAVTVRKLSVSSGLDEGASICRQGRTVYTTSIWDGFTIMSI